MTETIAFTVMLDGAATAMTCTIVGPANSCTLPGTLNLPARSMVGVRTITSAFGAPNILVSRSWTFS